MWRVYDTFKSGLTDEDEEMNKQELIDKAVHSLSGVWPKRNANDDSLCLTAYGLGSLCTQVEFQQRARKLGYINGYRWSVEYLTNGKKPDLPEDASVQVRNDIYAFWTCGQVGGLSWSNVFKFKITDQRYKPADTSYLSVSEIPESKSNAEDISDWYDYEAQKAVALPPVGEKVEVFLHWSESWSGWVVIVGHDHGGVIWRNGSDNKSYIYSPKDEIRPLDHATRKAETEKKRVVDAAQKVCVNFYSNDLGKLYDAGFLRMPAE
jgi:hypothetical protein